MNMISTVPFLAETDASTKQAELVKKLTTAWEKKNSKAARAGGVSLMALSLAACGGSDNTPFSQADIDTAVAAVDTTADDAAAILAAVQAVDASATTVAEVATNAAAAVDTSADDAAAILAAVQAVDASATTVAEVATNAAAAVDTSADDAAAISTALRDAAAGLGVTGTSTMTNAELITAIKTANDTDVANAVDLTTNDTAAINTAVAADTSFDTLAELVAAYNALANPSVFDAGVNNFTGTDAANTWNAGLTSAGGNTLNALDTLAGGDGADTLNATIATAVTPGTISSVETVNVTFTAGVALNLSNATGITSLVNIGSGATLGSVTNLASTDTALTVADNSGGATFTYQANAVTGSNDSISLTFNNATGAGTTTITGAVETINVTSSGSANSVQLDSGATTVNIAGDQNITLAAASTVAASATTVNAGDATGDVTVTSDHGTVGTSVTVTGGAGDDTLTLSGSNSATDTVSGGAGADRIVFSADLDDVDVVTGGAGSDTLAGINADIQALTTANNISGIEVIELTDAATGTLTTATIQAGIESVTLSGVDAAGASIVLDAGSRTVNLDTSHAGALTIADTGLATNDTLTIAAATGDNSLNGKNLTINGFETVNLSTGSNNLAASRETVNALAINGDPDSAGTNTSATLNISGAANLTTTTTTGVITVGNATTGTGTINAADMTGNFVMGAAAVGATTITGGSGDDTILGEDLASTLTGGAGSDTITGGSANDTVYGGLGADTLVSSGGTDTLMGEGGNDTFEMAVAEFNAADTLNGGDGTDTLELDGGAVLDAAFANKSSIEVLTSDADGISVTLGALAAASGIQTVTLAGNGTDDAVTFAAGFSATSVTVNLDDIDSGDNNHQNVVDGSAYTGSINFVGAATNTIDGANTGDLVITGGTGTGDTLTVVGGTYDATELAQVTAIETWTVSNDASASFTLADANVADGASLVIDGRAIVNTANTFAVVGTSEADGAVTVHGATGVDTITGTGSDLGDTINTYAGNDILNFAVNNLTTLDTVDGGAGTDTLKITSAGTLADADFTNVTNIEALTFTAAATSATLGAEYSDSGASTITLTTGANTVNMDAVTTAQTLNLVGGTDSIDASSMTSALTVSIDAAASLTSADTITAGTGSSDNLSITFGSGITATEIANVSGFETITAASDATGSLVTADANVASSGSLTIDLSAIATSAFTTNISAETNGQITITGGGATDTITMSASSMGDIINAGAGTDGITVAIGQLNSADTVDGGAGTDTLTFSDSGISADADFTNVSNMEVLATNAGANTLVLGSEYNEAGFATLTLSTATENVTFGAGVTAAQTVALSSAANTIDASASSAAYTFTAVEANVNATDTITGGSGTGDTLTITFNGTGVTAAEMANISGIETIKSASNAAGTLALSDANNATSSITVDVTANTSAAFSLDASAENDGTIVYLGGGGADTVTGTTGADTIGGGAGGDTITGGNGADSITGGAGSDTFTYTAVAQSTGTARDTITDFTSGTDVLAVTLDNSTSTADLTFDATVQTAQAGASAVAANLSGSIGQAIYDTTNSKLVINANADNLVTTLDYQIDMTAASTAANTVQAGDINYTITAGTGDDTIVAGAGADSITGGTGADTITGGTGLDTIALGATGDVDTIIYNTYLDGGAAGTDSAGDTVSGFVSTEDVFKIDGALATALDDITDNTALAFSTTGINDGDTTAAVAASLTATNEMLFLDTSNSALAAASLGDVSAVASALEAQITLTAATGDDGLIVVESSDTAGKFGVYHYEESGTNANQFDAAEITVLAIITADDVVAGDFITT